MANLNRKNKKQCQIVLAMLVPALLMQKSDTDAGLDPTKNAAVTSCMNMIDEIFASHADDQPTIDAMRKRIDAHRVRLTKKVAKFDTVDGLIGALQLLGSGFIKSKAGTRLDFILATFKANVANMKIVMPYSQEQADEFEDLFKKAIVRIG